MQAFLSILSPFHSGVISYDIKIKFEFTFWHEKVKILSLYRQHCSECHYVTLLNMLTISGLSNLMNGISLPDAMSYEK